MRRLIFLFGAFWIGTSSASAVSSMFASSFPKESIERPTTTTTTTTIIGGPYHSKAIRDWMQARCSDPGSALWVFTGALYDPQNGRKLADVEGMEVVRCLADTETCKLSANNSTINNNNNNNDTSHSYLSRCGDLKGPAALLVSNHPSTKNHTTTTTESSVDYATTLLSRKLFVYSQTQQQSHQQQYPRKILETIRMRPQSPPRTIPTSQAVALYDTATTYVSRRNGTELLLHTEWPNGQCVWGTATATTSTTTTMSSASTFVVPSSDKSLDFCVYAQKQQQQQSVMTIPDVSNNDNGGVVVSPKRSKWIQFGGGSPSSVQASMGARETYSYTFQTPTNNKPPSWFPRALSWPWDKTAKHKAKGSCRVRYTRYGEGPPWYGGKLCTLELQGHRVDRVEDAPPLAASFAAERLPGFLTVHTPISKTTDRDAQQAVKWFRTKSFWTFDNDNGMQQLPEDAGSFQRWTFRVKQGGTQVIKRLRAASTLTPSTGSN